MINYEIKSHLAKLLATEDLVVEHRNVTTAQFNVETRVLTLPLWKKASSVVYDMLVGHEVGHALFTPNRWDFKIPKQFVNVCEDVRILLLILLIGLIYTIRWVRSLIWILTLLKRRLSI